MNIQTSIVYGYGFDISVSDENLKNFILNHKESLLELLEENSDIEKVLKYVRQNDVTVPLKDTFAGYCGMFSADGGIYAIIADIMYVETGIRFEYRRPQDEDDQNEAIILPETNPWYFNEAEKAIEGEEQMDEILGKYMSELGIMNKPYSIRFEYFG